ncbi:MAG TPA: ABC transporter permease [Gaiellaceae bacterium]|nr:ABC transporter permease [Gaiellaceae bacterium]
MSVPVARRQLLARKGRTFAGIAGIATALLLVLALKAIFAGMEQRLTAYIDGSGADVIVAQRGVRSMHMTESALPERAARAITALPGVARARPILYVPATLERGDRRGLVYLIGEDPGDAPIALARGRRPGRGEIVLDRELAKTLRSPPGSSVRAFGRSFRVSGEVSGFTLISNAFAFVRRQDLAATLRSPGVVSYILVEAEPGVRPSELAERIDRAVPGVTASTREAFARSERRLVGDMSTDIVRAMILVGFVIGVAVAGLVAYSAALSQLREYAVLRALGLRARGALGLALAQVGTMVAAAFLLALALVWALAQLLPALSPLLSLAIKPGDVAQTLALAGAVALGAAAFPALRVSRVDPASVFRR